MKRIFNGLLFSNHEYYNTDFCNVKDIIKNIFKIFLKYLKIVKNLKKRDFPGKKLKRAIKNGNFAL
ncbi:MAG: hypothetical protein QM220_07755 [Atribacterota bacterium]|nr:hypothetical protein [Atribacterota bacterium]